jgi:hypothetical protein
VRDSNACTEGPVIPVFLPLPAGRNFLAEEDGAMILLIKTLPGNVQKLRVRLIQH